MQQGLRSASDGQEVTDCSPPSSLPLFKQIYSAHSTAGNHISSVIASDILKNVGINVVYETGIHVGNIFDLVLCVLQKSK
jgi:hypothetical protein